MSTCSGCWRDGRVPGGVGVLATSGGVFFVLHDPTGLCPTEEPHHADDCREFAPIRPGYEPDANAPSKPVRWMLTRHWRTVFDAIDRGERIIPIIRMIAAEPPI